MKLEMKREALRSLNRQAGQEQGQASEEQGFGTFRASNSHFGNLQAPKGSFGSVGQRHTRPATLKLSVPARTARPFVFEFANPGPIRPSLVFESPINLWAVLQNENC